jgi:hypothetical protein
VTRFSICALALLFYINAFAPSARAVDGVVLINQSTSVSGLSGCPHSGFPIIICKSGSYRLSGNLTLLSVNNDAIHITVNNVSLDLNGFTISGPATCTTGPPFKCSTTGTGIGIKDPTRFRRNITVRNGTVRGMGNAGIVLPGVGMLIEDVHAESNAGVSGAGILIGDGAVLHCTAEYNAADGILGGNVSFSDVSVNGRDGIVFAKVASNNSVSGNGHDGIQDAYLALNNALSLNVGFGIVAGSQHGYRGNMLSQNGGFFSGGVSLGENLCNGVVC